MTHAQIAADARAPYAKAIQAQTAELAALRALLERALAYLEHPEVESIPFAVRSSVTAAQIRAALAQTEEVTK